MQARGAHMIAGLGALLVRAQLKIRDAAENEARNAHPDAVGVAARLHHVEHRSHDAVDDDHETALAAPPNTPGAAPRALEKLGADLSGKELLLGVAELKNRRA